MQRLEFSGAVRPL